MVTLICQPVEAGRDDAAGFWAQPQFDDSPMKKWLSLNNYVSLLVEYYTIIDGL